MALSHMTVLRRAIVDCSRKTCEQIGRILLRANESGTSDCPITPELKAIVESMNRQWSSVYNWVIYEHTNPSPDPATATVDWPYPPPCLDHMQAVIDEMAQLTATLQEAHDRWCRHNRDLAAWHQGERAKEDRRFEQSVITSMYLPMEASDELVNRLRDVTGHEERMRIIRAMQEERGPIEHKIYTPGISIQERVEAAITARLAGARGDEE